MLLGRHTQTTVDCLFFTFSVYHGVGWQTGDNYFDFQFVGCREIMPPYITFRSKEPCRLWLWALSSLHTDAPNDHSSCTWKRRPHWEKVVSSSIFLKPISFFIREGTGSDFHVQSLFSKAKVIRLMTESLTPRCHDMTSFCYMDIQLLPLYYASLCHLIMDTEPHGSFHI